MSTIHPPAHRRLAIYGTLAPGGLHHDELDGMAGTWWRGVILGRYFAAVEGEQEGYPGVILDEAGERIEVHVFDSPDLPHHWARLDEFEGPGYRRVVTAVRTEAGLFEATIYELDI